MGWLRDWLRQFPPARVFIVAPPGAVRGVCRERAEAEEVIQREGLAGYVAQQWSVTDADEAGAGPTVVVHDEERPLMAKTMRNLTGWRRDLPDHRDLLFRDEHRASLFRAVLRPSSCYLRADLLPAVQDQGQLGSCVGNGVAELCDYVEAREGHPELLSRLAIYYWARGGVPEDSGATIRAGIKAVAAHGAPLERLWPYDVTRWKDAPSPEAQGEGAHRAVDLQYLRLQGKGDIQDCLLQGFPVVFGTMLFPQFEQVGLDGIVTMPGPHDAPIGGHCMLIVGYATKFDIAGHRGGVFVRNSWGPGWGRGGNCWLSWDYLAKFADDFWTIRRIAV